MTSYIKPCFEGGRHPLPVPIRNLLEQLSRGVSDKYAVSVRFLRRVAELLHEDQQIQRSVSRVQEDTATYEEASYLFYAMNEMSVDYDDLIWCLPLGVYSICQGTHEEFDLAGALISWCEVNNSKLVSDGYSRVLTDCFREILAWFTQRFVVNNATGEVAREDDASQFIDALMLATTLHSVVIEWALAALDGLDPAAQAWFCLLMSRWRGRLLRDEFKMHHLLLGSSDGPIQRIREALRDDRRWSELLDHVREDFGDIVCNQIGLIAG